MAKQRITKLNEKVINSKFVKVTSEELQKNRCKAYQYLIK